MADYLVLARKYRSRTFDEVIGQEHVARTLTSAIQTGRVAHAYLFTGTRGVGKTTMARILAKGLNCLSADGPTSEPCNECDACVSIARGDDVDVVEIDGASNRGIDEIRELRANAIYRPSRSRYKIYYIDEVHMLTKEAFNALLKTLEEPPGHVKFIFATTEVEKVPATILSRCQRFDFRNIPTREIAEHLAELCRAEDVKAETEALYRVARAANGSMRDGLSLLDQMLAAGAAITEDQVLGVLGTPPDVQVLAIAEAVVDGNAAEALGQLNETLLSGTPLASLATALAEAFRNMMVAATCGADSELIELPDAARRIVGELAGRMTVPALVHAVAVLEGVGRNLRASSIGQALLEAALVRLAEADKFVDADSLIARLEALTDGRSAGDGAKKKVLTDDPTGSSPARPPAGDRPPPRLAPVDRPGNTRRPPAATPDPTPPPRQAQPGEDATYVAEPAPVRQPFSTAEKRDMASDQAVQRVMSLFGGDIEDFLRDPPATPPADEAADEEIDADPDEDSPAD